MFLKKLFHKEEPGFTNGDYMIQTCVNGQFAEFYTYYCSLMKAAPYELIELARLLPNVSNSNSYIIRAGQKYRDEFYSAEALQAKAFADMEATSYGLMGRGNY